MKHELSNFMQYNVNDYQFLKRLNVSPLRKEKYFVKILQLANFTVKLSN